MDLQERNRLLVLENDELNAENMKLKEALTAITNVDKETWAEDIFIIKQIAQDALEELKHDNSTNSNRSQEAR